MRVESINNKKPIYSVQEGACQGGYSWNPDSQQIVFDSRHEGGSDIYVVDIDNNENIPINLTNTIDIHEYNPEWSPFGDAIVFSGVEPVNKEYSRDVQQNLYLFSNSTEEIIQLTNTESYDINPIWSPNGELIAFISTDGEALWNLEVIKSNGEDRRILASWVSED